MVDRNGLDVAEKNAEHIMALGYIAGLKKASQMLLAERGSYLLCNGTVALMDMANRITALIPQTAEGRMPDA